MRASTCLTKSSFADFHQSFRSNTPFGQGAESGFNNFQQANMAPDLAVNHMAPVADRAFVPPANHMAHGPQANHIAHGPPMMVSTEGFPISMGQTAERGWVNEFSTMNLGPNVAHTQTAVPNHLPQAHAQWGSPAMGLQTPFRPVYASPAFSSMHGNAPAFPAQQLASNAPQSQADLEAFNRAFGDYDEMTFEQDIAAWKDDQTAADRDFKEAEADWMAKHGPSAELQRAGQPSLEEMKVINENLEHLADELEQQPQIVNPDVAPPAPAPETEALRKRYADEQLAKAAVEIVNSVSDNSTEKFQNSQFLELMRRIANREVVVDGEKFVDAETGEGLVTSQQDAGTNDGDHQLASDTTPKTDG